MIITGTTDTKIYGYSHRYHDRHYIARSTCISTILLTFNSDSTDLR